MRRHLHLIDTHVARQDRAWRKRWWQRANRLRDVLVWILIYVAISLAIAWLLP